MAWQNGNGQPNGTAAISPNYSYANALGPMPQVSNVGTGLSAMADALINGYSGYLAQQRQNAPMQLQGGQPAPNFLQALFSAPPGAQSGPSVASDPSTDTGFY